MANNNQPTKWRAIDKRTGQWVEGWYVEHHWVERAGEAVYAEAHPCIFNDEPGKGAEVVTGTTSTLQPCSQPSKSRNNYLYFNKPKTKQL